MRTISIPRLSLIGVTVALAGCVAPPNEPSAQQFVGLRAATQPASVLGVPFDASVITPMHREILTIDLPSVLRVAAAQNLDILDARQQIQASRGRVESTIGTVLPTFTPGASYDGSQGVVRDFVGQLQPANFNTFQVFAAVQWVVNPGQVVYQLIAAKKRLYASEQQEQAVVIETLRLAAVQYYELVLDQARIVAAREALAEAEELLRIDRLRLKSGKALEADVLRAEAQVAERRGDLITSLSRFYADSIRLAVTLQLDAAVTLVPKADRIPPTRLIRSDADLDELLAVAVEMRPDLRGVRLAVEAAAADRSATLWSSLSPQATGGFLFGGITGHANNVVPRRGIPNNLIVNPTTQSGAFVSNPVANGLIREGILRLSQRAAGNADQTFAFRRQQRANAGVGWRVSPSLSGDLKTAAAVEEQTAIDAVRELDLIRAQVADSLQTSQAQEELLSVTKHQVAAAEEALRLTQANLRVGTMKTLDVLIAQDTLMQARVRQAEAIVRYNQAQVNLIASLGLLDQDGPALASVQ